MIIPKLSARQWRWVALVILLMLGVIVWAVFRYISPAPPKTITMTAGVADGAYFQFARKYRDYLLHQGIKLEVITSTGSVQNLERLQTGEAQVGLVQSGLGFLTTSPEKDPLDSDLKSLATVAYEPVWIFSRMALTSGLAPLSGKKIAVGGEGSGTRKVALDLLNDYGVNATNATLLPVGGVAAANQLVANEVDAVILISAPQATAVAQLLRAEAIKLVSLEHTDGLARRFPYLQPLVLKRGSVDPKLNLPATDVPLLSTTANLTVRDDLHPALAYLLLESAVHVHRVPSLFNRAEDFPSARGVDFPLAEESERYFKEGRPFLQRYLPFWLANFVQRLFLILVPLVAIGLPILKAIPEIGDFKDKNRLYYRYAELLAIETDLRTRQLTADEVAETRKKLDEIEEKIRKTRFPLDFTDRVFTLRQHVDYVRQKLDEELPSSQVTPANIGKA
jgi:TRAP transporter TAXI family solute receptor